MHATNNDIRPVDALAVDITGAAQLLSCGVQTAKIIVSLAGAKIDVPGRRALYSTEKIRDYIRKNAR